MGEPPRPPHAPTAHEALPPSDAHEAQPDAARDTPQEEPKTLLTAFGGRRGLADAGVPGIVFVAVYTVTSLTPAVWAAVAVAAVLTAFRLWRRETLQHALAGFFGVALGAFIAQRTGEAQNFFLPGLFINAGYAAVYLVSILVRWPLLGVVLGPLLGEGMAWRSDPPRMAAYRRTSWVWVAMFALRLAVQLPLYLAGAVVALGVVRLVMGWPLFLVTGWVSYVLLRSVPVTRPEPAVRGAGSHENRLPETETGEGNRPAG